MPNVQIEGLGAALFGGASLLTAMLGYLDIQFWLRTMEIISAITAVITAYMAHRSAREAILLASLAIARVSSSRESRLAEA